jgi:hypothetical protein
MEAGLKDRAKQLNDFNSYLESVKQFGGDEVDSLVDESQSREELERQVLDNNYMKEKIEEHRMNESFHSDRSNKPVKAIAFGNMSKPSLKPPVPRAKDYKQKNMPGPDHPIVKSYDQRKDSPIRELDMSDDDISENIESIQDRIKKQLEVFHKYKNDALHDCEDFMDEFENTLDGEGNKLVQIPEDFDDIVDIVVEEQSQAREYGEEEDEGEEVLDEDGKPFWMRYFKADYLGEEDPTYKRLLEKENIITTANKEESKEDKEGNEEVRLRLHDEFSRIKDLDTKLVGMNKVYKTMKEKCRLREDILRDHIQKEKELRKRKFEKKKNSYINSRTKGQTSSRGSSRSKISQSSKKSKNSTNNSSKGFSSNPFTGMERQNSAKKSAKGSQKRIANGKVEEDKSSTFLTGVQNQANKYEEIDQRIRDADMDTNQEFNMNDFELDMIHAKEEAMNTTPKRRRKKYDDSRSQRSSSSKNSSPGKVDFIKENTANIGQELPKSYTDRLTEHEKSRLLALEDEIDQSFLGNEDFEKRLLSIADRPERERLELMSAMVPITEAGDNALINGMKNAYVYEEGERMEAINDELKTKFLALPSPSDHDTVNDDISSMNNYQTSVFGDKKGSSKDYDIYSERSVQLTQISKRSGISGFSHSIVSKLSKPHSFPKEKILREKAEDKYYKQTMREIEDSLSQVRNINGKKPISDDQMSRLVDE